MPATFLTNSKAIETNIFIILNQSRKLRSLDGRLKSNTGNTIVKPHLHLLTVF